MTHTVKFTIPERDLGNVDAEFSVTHGKSKLGTLKVSVVWVPTGFTYGHKITWKDFDAFMKTQKLEKP